MTDPRTLGEALCAQYDDDQRAWLARDPAEAIPVLTDLTVELCEPEDFPRTTCPVEGLYFEQRQLITVMRTGARRTKFTFLHELGHHHSHFTDATAEAIAERPGGLGRRFEEQIADAFSAELLVPSADVEVVLEGRRPTAHDVADLYELVEGSREACCVRAAQHLGGDGYVILAQGSVVRFCAVSGDAYRIRRNTDQGPGHLLGIASRQGSAVDDQVRLQHWSGVETRQYGGQAVSRAGYVFGVFTESTSPPWGGWRVTGDPNPIGAEVRCPGCEDDVISWRRCELCTEMVCPRDDCGWCGCRGPGRPVIEERRCEACTQMKRIDLFFAGSGVCSDCT